MPNRRAFRSAFSAQLIQASAGAAESRIGRRPTAKRPQVLDADDQTAHLP